MTPNIRINQIRTVRTRRDRASSHMASRINHKAIAAAIAKAPHQGTFFLILEGDALNPVFKNGDLLTIAPDTLPLPGDAILALIDGRYGCMRINADGDLWDNAGGFVPRGSYRSAGVVLARRVRSGSTKKPRNRLPFR